MLRHLVSFPPRRQHFSRVTQNSPGWTSTRRLNSETVEVDKKVSPGRGDGEGRRLQFKTLLHYLEHLPPNRPSALFGVQQLLSSGKSWVDASTHSYIARKLASKGYVPEVLKIWQQAETNSFRSHHLDSIVLVCAMSRCRSPSQLQSMFISLQLIARKQTATELGRLVGFMLKFGIPARRVLPIITQFLRDQPEDVKLDFRFVSAYAETLYHLKGFNGAFGVLQAFVQNPPEDHSDLQRSIPFTHMLACMNRHRPRDKTSIARLLDLLKSTGLQAKPSICNLLMQREAKLENYPKILQLYNSLWESFKSGGEPPYSHTFYIMFEVLPVMAATGQRLASTRGVYRDMAWLILHQQKNPGPKYQKLIVDIELLNKALAGFLSQHDYAASIAVLTDFQRYNIAPPFSTYRLVMLELASRHEDDFYAEAPRIRQKWAKHFLRFPRDTWLDVTKLHKTQAYNALLKTACYQEFDTFQPSVHFMLNLEKQETIHAAPSWNQIVFPSGKEPNPGERYDLIPLIRILERALYAELRYWNEKKEQVPRLLETEIRNAGDLMDPRQDLGVGNRPSWVSLGIPSSGKE